MTEPHGAGGRAGSARVRWPDAVFAALVVLSLAVLGIGGDRTDLVQGLLLVVVFSALYAVTRRFTDPPAAARRPRAFAAAGVVVAFAFLYTLVERLPASTPAVAALSGFHWAIAARLAVAMPLLDVQSIDNTLRYVLFPGLVLVALGWKAADFGFGPSRRGTKWAVLLWAGPPLVTFGALAFFVGHGKPVELLHRFFIDIFRNGFAEEILFRGMLLRLAVVSFGIPAANVAQALLFGLWHLGADLRDVHGVVSLALADGVATQALFGYFAGLLTLRTGNVLTSGALHTLYDGGAIFA